MVSQAELRFTHRAWEPLSEPRSAYTKRVREIFNFQLSQYLDGIARATPNDWVPLPNKLCARHFQWLVRFQIGRESMAAIAKNPGVNAEPISYQAVEKGVHNSANYLIGADFSNWLNPVQKGGRPRKPQQG